MARDPADVLGSSAEGSGAVKMTLPHGRVTSAPRTVPISEPTDDRLVEEHLAGSASAFRELVRRYERRAATLAWRLLGNGEDVEEVCQEAFLKAHQKMRDLEQAGSFFPWFFSIVLNMCRERLRTRRRLALRAARNGTDTPYEVPIDDVADTSVPDVSEALAEDERREGLERALEALPVIYRQVIVLRCHEELSYTEIAQVMQCRKRTVRWRLYRARQILRRTLKDDEG